MTIHRPKHHHRPRQQRQQLWRQRPSPPSRSTIQQTAQVIRIPLLQRLTMMDFPTTVLHMTRQERAAHHHHLRRRRRRRQIVMIRPRPSSREWSRVSWSSSSCWWRWCADDVQAKRQKLLETASRQLSHKNKVRSSIIIFKYVWLKFRSHRHNPPPPRGGGGYSINYVWILGYGAARETHIFSPDFPFWSKLFSQNNYQKNPFRSITNLHFLADFAVPETIIFKISLISTRSSPPTAGSARTQAFGSAAD